MVKDRNDLDAIKLVMGDAVLFQTGKYALSAGAEAVLSRVAYNLDQFPDTDITVVGYTDNTGSEQLNQKLSEERAQSVGRAQNRRVEIFITAGQKMIENAQASK